jgi:hypothetical protein
MENFLFRDYLVEGRSYEDSASIIRLTILIRRDCLGLLLVVHNVFFESFHLTLELNKSNGIAESAMILSLDCAFFGAQVRQVLFSSPES